MPYDALNGSFMEQCVFLDRYTSSLQMRKERIQESNIHREIQVILAY
jgi:hypothetical protein